MTDMTDEKRRLVIVKTRPTNVYTTEYVGWLCKETDDKYIVIAAGLRHGGGKDNVRLENTIFMLKRSAVIEYTEITFNGKSEGESKAPPLHPKKKRMSRLTSWLGHDYSNC